MTPSITRRMIPRGVASECQPRSRRERIACERPTDSLVSPTPISSVSPSRRISVATSSPIVVTEHGIAHLRGKSVRERALELVAISDPRFREELQAAARELYW